MRFLGHGCVLTWDRNRVQNYYGSIRSENMFKTLSQNEASGEISVTTNYGTSCTCLSNCHFNSECYYSTLPYCLSPAIQYFHNCNKTSYFALTTPLNNFLSIFMLRNDAVVTTKLFINVFRDFVRVEEEKKS